MEDGKLKKDAKRVRRNGEVIGVGKIPQLQSGKQTVNELPEGNEGGLQFDGKLKLKSAMSWKHMLKKKRRKTYSRIIFSTVIPTVVEESLYH